MVEELIMKGFRSSVEYIEGKKIENEIILSPSSNSDMDVSTPNSCSPKLNLAPDKRSIAQLLFEFEEKNTEIANKSPESKSCINSKIVVRENFYSKKSMPNPFLLTPVKEEPENTHSSGENRQIKQNLLSGAMVSIESSSESIINSNSCN